ncbi:MAG: AAA family ATPase [Sphingomonas sp.]
MTEMRPIRRSASLLERAADHYDFGGVFVPPIASDAPAPVRPEPVEGPFFVPQTAPERKHIASTSSVRTVGARENTGRGIGIDRALLMRQGMLVPGAPIGALVEEFRLIKRQLLIAARAIAAQGDKARMILICSANPNEGKTWCAINLAMSLAAERDTEVLLVDADFAKPDVLRRLGSTDRPGLLDALANPGVQIEDYVLATDVPQLSLLPAGTRTPNDTELVASERTATLLSQLIAANPRRLILFDSPPVLAASPAATLAHQVGQVMMVVRADKTSESDLRDAVGLLDGCEHIQLVLNAVSFALGGRRYGSYYGQESPL